MNPSDNCQITNSILKSIHLFKQFSEILSKAVHLVSSKLMSKMIKTHLIDIAFTFNAVISPSNHSI